MNNHEIITVSVSVNGLACVSGDMTNVISGLNEKGELTPFLNKEYKGLRCDLTYPFNGAIVFIDNVRSIADILQPIARYYKNEIYANPKQHGVYGHKIEDLCFERIIIKGNKVEIFIGS